MNEPSLVEDLKKSWFLLILIACGFICLIYSMRELYTSKTIYNWPKTEATIEESYIGNYREESRRRGRRESYTVYTPAIKYSYVVDGRRYENWQIMHGGNPESRNRENIQPLVDRFPAGKTVTVYYHPRDHQRSILILYTQSFDMTISLVLGLMLVGFNALIFYQNSAWCQYQFNYVPEKEVKEQPDFMKPQLSRRERKQQRMRQR